MSLPITVIRGGTSRGVYLRAGDLPTDPGERTRALLRLFAGDSGALTDGVGGESPLLRKVALVEPGPDGDDGAPGLRYTFGQVSAALDGVDHSVECGNIASGVPLFGSLQGWVPQPNGSHPADGDPVWIELANTGRRIRAAWRGRGGEYDVELGFPVSAPRPILEEAMAATRLPDGRTVRWSAVSAMNTYLFVDGPSLGVSDPASAQVDAGTYQAVDHVVDDARERMPGVGTLKVCLVAGGRDGVSGLILYPAERRSHPSFAVTGGVTLAVAACTPGTVVNRLAVPPDDERCELRVRHPSGSLDFRLRRTASGEPASVSIDRTCRLILSGTAY